MFFLFTDARRLLREKTVAGTLRIADTLANATRLTARNRRLRKPVELRTLDREGTHVGSIDVVGISLGTDNREGPGRLDTSA